MSSVKNRRLTHSGFLEYQQNKPCSTLSFTSQLAPWYHKSKAGIPSFRGISAKCFNTWAHTGSYHQHVDIQAPPNKVPFPKTVLAQKHLYSLQYQPKIFMCSHFYSV